MRKRDRLSILITVVAALVVPAADAELISIIHALPDGPGDWTSNSPIDIKVDGVCEFTRVFYGEKIGPLEIARGRYKMSVHAHKIGAPCRGKKLASGRVKIKKNAEVDTVIYLANPSGGGKLARIKTFDNRESLRPVLGGDWDAAVEVRSVYQSGPVSAVLLAGGTEIGSGDVAPGKTLGPFQTTAATHELTVSEGDTTIDSTSGRVRNVRAYWAYVVGAVDEASRELLVFESVPLEPPPIGGGGDGGRPPANQNTCCINPGKICSPLGFSNCSLSGGIYIGDIGCNPNPCG